MPFSYVQFMTELMAPLPYPRQPNFAPPPLAPLRKPIGQSTIGIFTSAGIQVRGEPALNETNDLTYRLIDGATPYSDLTVAHQTPVRSWALDDLNVAFPRDRLVELEAEGTIGKLAPKAVSMVGSISKFTELIKTTAPRIKAEFDAQGVDLVFLFPF
ncbi:MAG TPA: glycine/sarcosine/betaine reductase selenoprotein B family protein [Candidatus Deferrimicrobium sp.]|nr:glycine/sarcosine/betaine reductase selenoprotein B family protein [Candidatus Deferrimicrobium sp.]